MPTISRKNVPDQDGRVFCLLCHGEIPSDHKRQRNGEYRDFCSDVCRAAWQATAMSVLQNAGLLGKEICSDATR